MSYKLFRSVVSLSSNLRLQFEKTALKVKQLPEYIIFPLLLSVNEPSLIQ